ncbi:hypothetical protein F4778DRAFT_350697 [Xylariomycetidae sp. FL2044]|nr:hypothetical protein F4778DRAFT_350697 [Xylariomycetidae sp. FL2044]
MLNETSGPSPTPLPPSGGPADLYEVVLRQKYNDPRKLKAILDDSYGFGKYRVKIRANRYILMLPQHLGEDQIAELEQSIRIHYRGEAIDR